ncbi:tail fiber protein [Pseudomonas gingeri]|nr:tail fiber protein [Pseudomonas gingeri]
MNISGLGPKNIMQYDASGNKVAAVIQGQLTDIVYDGADFVLLDQLPQVQAIPVGTIFTISTQVPPLGTIKANGAAVSRTTYPALFSTIGVTYGSGDGSTTFNLPDLRGEFIRGWDDGRGVDAGRVFGSFQNHMFQNHTHYSSSSGWVNNGGNATGGAGVAFGQSGDNTVTSGSFGAETRPRNISLLRVIKY